MWLAVTGYRASERTYNLGEVRVLSLEERINWLRSKQIGKGRIIRVPSGTCQKIFNALAVNCCTGYRRR